MRVQRKVAKIELAQLLARVAELEALIAGDGRMGGGMGE
jgi:hypothetical protein